MFEVGQIIYLLDNNEMKIIPVQVIEQVVKRKFNEDSETSYVVRLPRKTLTTLNLNEVDATVYTDINELREFMVNNATQSIDSMLTRSKSLAQTHFEIDVIAKSHVRDDSSNIE
jgi:hypothetical protein